ncbi:MAG: 2,3-diketo-5-methylthiopentyl-1-phosphate enolase [candidate division WS2 bacterium]|nr:2,3-diketo-5-methylthiopentyl-1-phosphate enolase [Candidatus Psychracetigena formicireducens]
MISDRGTGKLLKRITEHPYIKRSPLGKKAVEKRILNNVNKGREYRGKAVETTYYLTAISKENKFKGIEDAIKKILVHGTTENWPGPEKEPEEYKKHMSWLKEVKLWGVNLEEAIEAAMVTISTPLESFDKKKKGIPLAQLRVATSSEPFNAFSDFTARVVDYRFPEEFKNRFLGQVWPHKRIREYLNVGKDEPIIGTIVKPKWLPRELFAQRVVEAANAGALFVKSDENLHLTREELAGYVSLTVKILEENNFDLSPTPRAGRKRFLFAPHITVNPFDVLEYAKIAVDCGANILCFSPHLSGDFEVIRKIYEMGDKYKVPIYAHTAGMNRYAGDPNYSCGEDARTVYLLAALSGAAFMQLPALRGYLRPTDIEKIPIIERLKEEGLAGNQGMTLAIAGGLSTYNLGYNIEVFGPEGKVFLVGTGVYHHPDGVRSGVSALKLTVEAAYKGIIEIKELKAYAKSLGERGYPLLRVLK